MENRIKYKMLIKCPHCGCPYNPYDGYEMANSQTTEVIDDTVYITTDYQCPHCRGIMRGTQQSYEIPMWYAEEFEAV